MTISEDYAKGILSKNKKLYVPTLLLFLTTFSLTLLLLSVSGILNASLFNLNPTYLSILTSTPEFVLSLLVYIILIINAEIFFVSMKYGMIKELLHTGKTSIDSGIKFAIHNYAKSFSIHFLSWAVIYAPLFVISFLVVGALGLLSINLQAMAFIFFVFSILYIIYLLARINIHFPYLSFHLKGGYHSFKTDVFFVKSHASHLILSWVLSTSLAVSLAIFLYRDVLSINSILLHFVVLSIVIILFVLEILTSHWEHKFIFEYYHYHNAKSGIYSNAKNVDAQGGSLAKNLIKGIKNFVTPSSDKSKVSTKSHSKIVNKTVSKKSRGVTNARSKTKRK